MAKCRTESMLTVSPTSSAAGAVPDMSAPRTSRQFSAILQNTDTVLTNRSEQSGILTGRSRLGPRSLARHGLGRFGPGTTLRWRQLGSQSSRLHRRNDGKRALAPQGVRVPVLHLTRPSIRERGLTWHHGSRAHRGFHPISTVTIRVTNQDTMISFPGLRRRSFGDKETSCRNPD